MSQNTQANTQANAQSPTLLTDNPSHQRVVILGGGSFGTAIGNIAADNGCDVTLWMRNKDVAADINTNHVNSRYLQNYPLNPQLKASTEDPGSLVRDADVIFVAIPSKAFLSVLKQIKGNIHDEHLFVSCTKGIYPDGFLLMSQLIKQETGSKKIGVLSGPNLAKEILERQITASVIASPDKHLCDEIQEMLSCDYFRVYSNSDIYGVELAGALKNIYAIASGMAAAMNAGQNSHAMLVTRSLNEMGRFAKRLGGKTITFLGLAGVGDLMVTCSSPLSRNYQVGYQLGKGLSIEEAVNRLGQTAEGINTIKIVKAKADELDIYMPILSALHGAIFEGQAIASSLKTLMTTDLKEESDQAMWQ